MDNLSDDLVVSGETEDNISMATFVQNNDAPAAPGNISMTTIQSHVNHTAIGMQSLTFVGTFVVYVDVPVIVVLSLIIIAGSSNLGVIVSLTTNNKLRKPFNCVVVCMAVYDLVMSEVVACMELVDVIRMRVAVGQWWCTSKVFMRTLTFCASLLLITAVAVLRAVSGLASHRIRLQYRQVAVLAVLVGVCSLGVAVAFAVPGSASMKLCLGDVYRENDTYNELLLLSFLVVTLLLFFISITSYSILGAALKFKNNFQLMSSKAEILTVRVGLIVFTIFMVCYLIPFVPYFLPNHSLGPPKEVLHKLSVFTTLAFLQSALNPLVYYWSNSLFRKSICQLLHRLLQRLLHCCCRTHRWTRATVAPMDIQHRLQVFVVNHQRSDATRPTHSGGGRALWKSNKTSPSTDHTTPA